MTYKIGMRVNTSCEGDSTYLLAQVGIRKVCAVGLKGGNRYAEPVDVADACKLTKNDLWRILAGRCGPDRWTFGWRYKGKRIFSKSQVYD